jgi:hypothetical protein
MDDPLRQLSESSLAGLANAEPAAVETWERPSPAEVLEGGSRGALLNKLLVGGDLKMKGERTFLQQRWRCRWER